LVTACDAIVVGGGPAGSTVARRLHDAGADVVVIDRARFPRDKRCAGWITPQVVETLALDLDGYRQRCVLQPITAFRTCRLGDPPIDTEYGRVVSYGIRRWEFDDYLLARSGARLATGRDASRLERTGGAWGVVGEWRAPILVGAGGDFCPVARRLNPGARSEPLVAAQEVEFQMTPTQAARCHVAPERPHLYFCADLGGYGWAFRKGDYLNVGLGRLDRHVASHARAFLAFLVEAGAVPPDLPSHWPGHAYRLHASAPRAVVADGVVLVGDAAGLAYPESGEGIRPAIESGVLAARAILAAGGRYGREDLAPYAAALGARLDAPRWRRALGALLPRPARAAVARYVLSTRALTRRVVLDGWFLHAGQPALTG
jgi:flavin-dependent dehydrogenase